MYNNKQIHEEGCINSRSVYKKNSDSAKKKISETLIIYLGKVFFFYLFFIFKCFMVFLFENACHIFFLLFPVIAKLRQMRIWEGWNFFFKENKCQKLFRLVYGRYTIYLYFFFLIKHKSFIAWKKRKFFLFFLFYDKT